MHTSLMPSVSRIALPVAAAALAVLGGCGSSLPVTSRETAYAGPGAVIDSSGTNHTIVIEAPTPGYVVSLDAVRDRLNGREALVSIREPDPRFIVAQVIVTQRIGTDVPSSVPLDVYIREMPHDSRENRPYLYAGTSGTP